MADTTFANGEYVPIAWIQDVNNATYRGLAQNFSNNSGSVNALQVVHGVPWTSLNDGQTVWVRVSAANTTPVTLQIDQLNALPVVDSSGALSPGAIAAGGVYGFVYNAASSNFYLLNSYSSRPAVVTSQIIAAAPAATQSLSIASGATAYFTSGAANNWTLNISFASGTTTLDTAMAVGETAGLVVMTTQGATAYYNTAVQIDGVAVTPKWLGGAPTAGNASGIDVYTYAITKTAAGTFTVLASQAQYK